MLHHAAVQAPACDFENAAAALASAIRALNEIDFFKIWKHEEKEQKSTNN